MKQAGHSTSEIKDEGVSLAIHFCFCAVYVTNPPQLIMVSELPNRLFVIP